MVSSSTLNIATNFKINLDDDKHAEKDKPDVKLNKPDVRSIKETKDNTKVMKAKPDMNKITYEEEKAALISGITTIFTVWWIFK